MRNILIGILFYCVACADSQEAKEDVKLQVSEILTPSGLTYKVVEHGRGPTAEPGDQVLIHETTKLKDGTVITDTWEMNYPIEFLLGGNQVIDGLDEAVTGMRVGERRKLIVPPSLSVRSSYPDNGRFGPNDTLYYDVLVLKTSKPSPH